MSRTLMALVIAVATAAGWPAAVFAQATPDLGGLIERAMKSPPKEAIPLYEQAGNSKGLAGAIEVKLLHEEDPSSRLELFRQVAGLYEAKLKEPQRAFERFLSAFEIEPGDEQCVTDVERAARATGGWDALIAAFQAAIARAESDGDVMLGITLRLRLGHVLRDPQLRRLLAGRESDDRIMGRIRELERPEQESSR